MAAASGSAGSFRQLIRAGQPEATGDIQVSPTSPSSNISSMPFNRLMMRTHATAMGYLTYSKDRELPVAVFVGILGHCKLLEEGQGFWYPVRDALRVWLKLRTASSTFCVYMSQWYASTVTRIVRSMMTQRLASRSLRIAGCSCTRCDIAWLGAGWVCPAVLGRQDNDWQACSRCACFRVFQGMTDECCLVKFRTQCRFD